MKDNIYITTKTKALYIILYCALHLPNHYDILTRATLFQHSYQSKTITTVGTSGTACGGLIFTPQNPAS